MVGGHLELAPGAVLLVEVDIGEMPHSKAEKYMADIKAGWQEVFTHNQVMVVPLGRVRVSAISH